MDEVVTRIGCTLQGGGICLQKLHHIIMVLQVVGTGAECLFLQWMGGACRPLDFPLGLEDKCLSHHSICLFRLSLTAKGDGRSEEDVPKMDAGCPRRMREDTPDLGMGGQMSAAPAVNHDMTTEEEGQTIDGEGKGKGGIEEWIRSEGRHQEDAGSATIEGKQGAILGVPAENLIGHIAVRASGVGLEAENVLTMIGKSEQGLGGDGDVVIACRSSHGKGSQ